MRFHIVDVFAQQPYAGNQLAVFLCSHPLPGDEMQAMAREIHFSESAFVLDNKEGPSGWPVRIFTPAHEVEFAGHPSLGTAQVIRQELAEPGVEKINLALRAGVIPVELSAESSQPLWMEQLAPQFKEKLTAAALAKVLGLGTQAIDTRFPIEEVSTGLPHIMVPLRSLNDLRQARVVKERYWKFIENTWAKNIMVFCLQGRDGSHDLSVRMFADYLGIEEDPATGSGIGCLAGYLVRHRCLGSKRIALVAGQGHELGRPSLLHMQAEESPERIRIRVGGCVQSIAKGLWPARIAPPRVESSR